MELRQVVLAKRLFNESVGYSAKGTGFHNGLAVSMAQDACEIMLRAVCNAHLPTSSSKTVDKKTAFDGLLQAVDSIRGVPAKLRLLELNNARVAFKHYGQTPSAETALLGVNAAESFLVEAAELYFSTRFDQLSLADLVRSDEVRRHLKEAEGHLDAERLADALTSCAKAFYFLRQKLAVFLPEPDNSLLHLGDGLDDSVAKRRVNDVGRYLKDYLAVLQRMVIAAALKFDVKRLAMLRVALPTVARFGSGDFQTTFLYSICSAERTKEAIDAVTDLALAIEADPSFAA